MVSQYSFPELSDLFAGKAKDKLQCFQLVKALIADFEHTIRRELHESIASALVTSVFGFNSVSFLAREKFVDGEAFIKHYVECIHGSAFFNLAEEPLCMQSIPPALEGSFILEPLVGANAACLWPHSINGIDLQARRFVLLWYNNHPQRTDVCFFIIDLRDNSLYAFPTYGFWIYDDLLSIFLAILPINLWADPVARTSYFLALPASSQLALLPANCPVHFGHYIQNSLAHLARLEELGIINKVHKIYRPNIFDYFLPEQERLFFLPTTQSKIVAVNSFQQAIDLGVADNSSLIVSKGSTIGRSIAKNFRDSIVSFELFGDTELQLHARTAPIRICVGIRGGTRMCLNLLEYSTKLATALFDKFNRSIVFVVDGMSSSALNKSDSTALLSPAHESNLANSFLSLSKHLHYLSAVSVVGLTQYDQLTEIHSCSLALSGFGTQSYKYMYLCDIPTVIHGERPADQNLDPGQPPVSFFLGADCLESIDYVDDTNRHNYKVNVEEAVARSMAFVVELGLFDPFPK